MKIKLKYHEDRTGEAMKRYQKWYLEYIGGKNTKEIAMNHINPTTGKPYTRANIYYGFEQLSKVKR